MTTLRMIVYRALRQVGAASIGEEIAPEDFEVGLEALQDLLQSLPNYGAGRRLADVASAASVTAAVDERHLMATTGLTLTLPKCPERGARVAVVPITAGSSVTVKPNGRKLEGANVDVVLTASRFWLYNEDEADWKRTDNLDANSQSPYPTNFDRDLSFLICEILDDEFGEGLSPTLASNIINAKAKMSAYFARPKAQVWDLPISVRGPGITRYYL